MKTNSKVRDILERKGNIVWKIEENKTVFEALNLMAEKDIGALLVVDKNDKIAGIFSERDYARKCILKGRLSKETKVEELMSKKVYYTTLEDKIEDVLALMTEKKIRHLPVIENEKLVGIVSIGDVVKFILEDQSFIISNLIRYIQSG